jgi:hypothetical protein
MSANTAKAGLTTPSLSDVPNIPANMATIAGQLDGMVIPTYATSTAMNTANGTPKAGDICYRTDLTAYMMYNGSGWYPVSANGWKTYTATWAGLTTLGSAVSTGRYRQLGKTIDVMASLTWGTSSVLGTGNITVSLPFAAASGSAAESWFGIGRHVPAANPWEALAIVVGSGASTANVFSPRQSDLAWAAPGSVSTTFWQSGSSFTVQLTYEAA